MKKVLMLLLLSVMLGCSESKKVEEKPDSTSTVNNSPEKARWLTYVSNEHVYIDTTKINFELIFKYPPNLIAEAIENGRCIGRKKAPESPDDPITNTMDCSIWLTEIGSEPIASNLEQLRKSQTTAYRELMDTITIVNKQALRIQFMEEKTNQILTDNVFVDLKECNTSLHIINDRLSAEDFEFFLSSIQVRRK